MTKRRTIALIGLGLGLTLTTGCSNKGGDEGAGSPVPPADPPSPEAPEAPETPETPETPDTLPPPGDTAQRPVMTNDECTTKGGTIVGDIGDGAIHRPDYLCKGGQPPMGTIRSTSKEAVAVEGSVCCPAATP